VKILSDIDYRERALEGALQFIRIANRPLSLCDMVTRLIIEDVDVQVNALLTLDPGHFADVCQKRRVELL
jgi:hypothetical protein